LRKRKKEGIYRMNRQVVVFLVISNSNKILLEKKRDDHPNEPGCILLPGGHVEYLEDPVQTVRRELKEEFGIENVVIEFLEEHPDYISKSGNPFHCFYYKVTGWNGEYQELDVNQALVEDLDETLLNKLDIELDKRIVQKILLSKMHKQDVL